MEGGPYPRGCSQGAADRHTGLGERGSRRAEHMGRRPARRARRRGRDGAAPCVFAEHARLPPPGPFSGAIPGPQTDH
eukprot:scaffold9778_cov72-Phaeocystis_antarctica.AAC.7